MRGLRVLLRAAAPPALAVLTATRPVAAQGASPGAHRADAASIVRALGPRAIDAFAPPGAPGVGALARLPAGVHGADWGIREVAPGIGRLWGQPADILAFADAHPGATIEMAPPLRPLLDTASVITRAGSALPLGLDGTGVLVGVADTGIDVTHGDFIDPAGHTRVAWLLDLSAPPRGAHADLEQMFGSTVNGKLAFGAVWSGAEIDAAMGAQGAAVPGDPSGHGTLVASCAAGNAEGGRSRYRGMAPNAGLLVARITDASEENIGNDELLRGVAFLMNRADALALPVVVNLSIGTDFGPHDGTMAWEQTLASYVGPTHPGRAIVVAAGNSGDIADAPIHQQVHVSSGTTMRVPIATDGAMSSGGVQVWVAIHGGASLSVGLDNPGGTWVDPVPPGQSAGSSDHNAGIYNGSQPKGSLVPAQSNGAVVVWQGAWAAGTFYVTLSGTGTADLYLQATGDASIPGVTSVSFSDGVREGTIGLPATHPALIGVGCTINKTSWLDARSARIGVPVPLLDDAGADALLGSRDPIAGEPCWFSGAGPTLTGLPKPDIMAPGAAIVGAMSAQAVPPAPASIFTNPSCPGAADPSCQQADATHGVALGTSFSSPVVAGIVALMLQHDRTLTQDWILAALQGGAHRLRGAAPFDDQAGAGEVDAMGALAAVDLLNAPRSTSPVRAASWMTLGADEYLADGTTPIEAVLQLRAPSTTGGAPPVPADGFDPGRLVAYALVDGVAVPGVMAAPLRRGPGVWLIRGQLAAGRGASALTLGVTFDGVDIVGPRTIPIATDTWSAVYPPRLQGGCSAARGGPDGAGWAPAALVLPWLARARRGSAQRRRRRCSR